MYIDSAAIITIASVLGALTAIGAVAYKIIKWFQAQEKQTSVPPYGHSYIFHIFQNP